MERIKLTAPEGKLLTNGEVYGKVVFPGDGDTPDNWKEITEEEYNALHPKEETEV